MERDDRALMQTVDALEEQFPLLQEKLAGVQACIREKRLADEGAVGELCALLQNYIGLSEKLRLAGEALHISLAPNPEGIRQQLAMREKERRRRLQACVRDYFRLRAGDAALAELLEETKQALRRKCLAGADDPEGMLFPYSLVVAHAREAGAPLSDEAYDCIEAQIGRKIARACDLHALTLDAGADIQRYLDASCEWLRPEEDSAEAEAGPAEESVSVPPEVVMPDVSDAQPVGDRTGADADRQRPEEDSGGDAHPEEGAEAPTPAPPEGEDAQPCGDRTGGEVPPSEASAGAIQDAGGDRTGGEPQASESGEGDSLRAEEGRTQDGKETSEAGEGAPIRAEEGGGDADDAQPLPEAEPEADDSREDAGGAPEDADSVPPGEEAGEPVEEVNEGSAPPLWEAFDGYPDSEARFTLSADTPASELKSSVFERHLKKTNGTILRGIYATAMAKICSDEGIDDKEKKYQTVPPSKIDLLFRQGYLRKLDRVCGESTKSYWLLSSKGWACFTKKEVVRHFEQEKLRFRKKPYDNADLWNALILARLAALYDYMVAARIVYEAELCGNLVCGKEHRAKAEDIYIPAVFARGAEDIGELCALLRSKPTAERFVFIVRSASDAQKLGELLETVHARANDGDQLPLDKIRFVRKEQPGAFFRAGEQPAAPAAENAEDEDAPAARPDGEEGEQPPEAAAAGEAALHDETPSQGETTLPGEAPVREGAPLPGETAVQGDETLRGEAPLQGETAVPDEAAAQYEAALQGDAPVQDEESPEAEASALQGEAPPQSEASRQGAAPLQGEADAGESAGSEGDDAGPEGKAPGTADAAERSEAEAARGAAEEAAPQGEQQEASPGEAEQAGAEAETVRQYLRAARLALIEHGRSDVTSVMLQALALRDPELKSTAEQFACATGDPAIGGSCNSNKLQEVFNLPAGSDAATDTLAAAAYLRMYFSSAAREQTYLSRDMSHQGNNLALKKYTELSTVLFSLANLVKRTGRGLDAELLGRLRSRHGAGEKQRELQERALELLQSRLTESSHFNQRIKQTRNILFGAQSDLCRLLHAIRTDDPSQTQTAEGLVNEDVDGIIDEAWRKAAQGRGFGRNDSCTGVERTTLRRQLSEIRALAKDWLAIRSPENRLTDEYIRDAESLIAGITGKLQNVLEKLSGAGAELPVEQQAAEAALAQAIRDCLARIGGEETEEEQALNYYIRLLWEPLIALEDPAHPHIETPEEETEPFDFCRRALGYLDAPERSWEEVLRRIFAGTGREHNDMDYGCAAVLRQYLARTGQEDLWKDEYDIDAAVSDAIDRHNTRRNSVARWEQDFTARLEMADGDNWFDGDANLRSHIHRALDKQKEAYYYSENFGFYGRAMNRLLEMLRRRAELLQPRYLEEYRTLLEGFSEEDREQEVFAQIREMIEKNRFGTAESFMQQVRSGNLTLNDGELSGGVLSDFLDEVNRRLYRLARLDSRKSLGAVYRDLHHNRIVNAIQKSGDILLHSWPEGGNYPPDKLRNFFRELDREVSEVTGKDTEFIVRFRDPGVIKNYPHPMAAFGSEADRSGMDVAVISGNRDADGLYTEIDKLLRRNSSHRSMLLFVNSAITVPERRKLARSVSRFASNKAFLLLDRCLALFLADVPRTDRWKTLLRCALPFRVINPYYESSSMPIPPDMFIGRTEEINGIIDEKGPNLLYGGRQLGKTAILRRVERMQNRPQEGQWACYVDIRDKDHADAVETIVRTLQRADFLPPDCTPGTWKELLQAIEDRLMDRPEQRDHKLLLMLDEADNLLQLLEGEGYRTLGDMKTLQQTTDGRFKFVLAGLHNVLRFGRDSLGGNSVLPHLGGITIQPMKFSEARTLLETPLSYLGFTIRPGDEDIIAQILYNTNYFPGLIHFYASRLVEHVKEIASSEMPPYQLTRDMLLRLIGEDSFRKQRRDKLMMTLKLDEKDQDAYYYTLACALAMLCYESEDIALHGASAKDIQEYCKGWEPDCRIAKQLAPDQVEALLDELVGLNILRREEQGGTRRYLFSRISFLEMLGSEDEVSEHFLEALQGEVDAQ